MLFNLTKLTGIFVISLFTFLVSCQPAEKNNSDASRDSNFSNLETLFQEWREFEEPPLIDGVPDYTAATFDKRMPEFREFQNRLMSFDTSGWSRAERVDWSIVHAEMNGYDFNYRVLKPWVRDPAFYRSVYHYRSDVPAHEGPTHHKTTEVWMYEFPLEGEERAKFIDRLKVIAPLYEQAKTNLSGNARELWIAGIGSIKRQEGALERIKGKKGIREDEEIMNLIDAGIAANSEFVEWLESQVDLKTGPSGVGKENYEWYQQNVHLVPLTWEEEVMVLKRELARAWTALKLEEHYNRNLPEITDVNTQEDFDTLTENAIRGIIDFLDEEDIVTVKPYWEPALREHIGTFRLRGHRNFFWIGFHYDPRPLYSHFYHWFELARMDTEPNERLIRREPLLYNIFDSRNEGVATAVEEMFLQTGLYDGRQRSKEIVYIMLAQRAARGLGSLYAHANEMTMEEAGGIHSKYTPRGWMQVEQDLLIFEQHLYMRQPGYGTSYVTGKHLLEDAMADYAKMKEAQGKEFVLKEFFDELNRIGCIPMSLGHMEMTGKTELIDNN